MLDYSRDIIEFFYDINKTKVLIEIIIDIKRGLEISPEGRALVLNKIKELKAINDWDYEEEERLLQMYKRHINNKIHVEALSQKDRESYKREILKRFKEYDFSL